MGLIKLEKKENTSFLILNRQEVKNAINPELLKELYSKLEEIKNEDFTRFVVITGSGDIFSSGADLNWMKEGNDFKKDSELLFNVLFKIFTFPKIIFSAVNGPAFGGALGIISACDFAVASEGAKFAFAEVKLGIAPAIISPFVLRKVKIGWARYKFLTGEVFDSKEGLEAGLFEKVFPKEKFDENLKNLIEDLKKGGPLAQMEIKKLFLKEKDEILKMKDGLCDLLYKLRSSEEGKEGLSAFFEKRRAKW
jgi:methylglutaconyl-CoA hydratase